jgi:hypothetical protein
MQGQERRGMMADYGAQMGQAAFDANNANFQRTHGLGRNDTWTTVAKQEFGVQFSNASR